MAKINNFIKINGEYVAQQDIPAEQMREISRAIVVNLAKGLGYIPAEKEDDTVVRAETKKETHA